MLFFSAIEQEIINVIFFCLHILAALVVLIIIIYLVIDIRLILDLLLGLFKEFCCVKKPQPSQGRKNYGNDFSNP